MADFAFNQPHNAGRSILLAGRNFGCGSSREHAPWALTDLGLRAIVSSEIADIFRGNSGKQGLIAGEITDADTEKLWAALEADPGSSITINLVEQTATIGDLSVHFEIDEYTKWRLLEGLDDIGLTLRDEQAITDFEAKRPSWMPKTLPAKH